MKQGYCEWPEIFPYYIKHGSRIIQAILCDNVYFLRRRKGKQLCDEKERMSLRIYACTVTECSKLAVCQFLIFSSAVSLTLRRFNAATELLEGAALL